MARYGSRVVARGVAFGSLVAIVAMVSCLPGARAPNVQASRTLELGTEPAGKGSAKPFGVVFASPKGPTREAPEVSVVFNRPMRSMSLAGEEGAVPVVLEPAVKGEFRWMGTSAVAFIPATALPRATSFKAKVPANTKALDGSLLGADYTFEFMTARPAVVRMEPENADHLKPTATFTLYFNQPVSLAAVKAAARLTSVPADGKGKPSAPMPFSVAFAKDDVKTKVVLTPEKALPLGSRIKVAVEGLLGVEGPLPSVQPFSSEVSTYGPLLANNVTCTNSAPDRKCGAHDGFYLELSNAVKPSDLYAHVRVEGAKVAWPKKSADDSPQSGFSLPIQVRPASEIRVTITAGLVDVYGQTLARDRTFTLAVGDERPHVGIGLRGEVFEANATRPRMIPIHSTNVPSYRLATTVLNEQDVVAAMNVSRGQFDFVLGLPATKESVISAAGPRNVPQTHLVSLEAALGGRGALALVAERDLRIVQVTDLGMTARLSKFGSVVWVNSLATGKPVPGATVAVRDKTGAEIFSAPTDAQGLCVIPSTKWKATEDDGNMDVLFVRKDKDWSYRAVRDNISPWRYGVTVDLDGGLSPDGMLFTDRGIYRAGESVQVKGVFRRPLERGTAVPRGENVEFVATDREGTELVKQTVALNEFGAFTASVPLPKSARLGQIELRAAIGNSGHAYANVDVAAYRPAEFSAKVEASKPSYVRGDTAQFSARGDYLFGAPMLAGTVRTQVTYHAGSVSIPGYDESNYTFSDSAYLDDSRDIAPRGGTLLDRNGQFDAKGVVRVDAPLTFPKQNGPLVVTAESEIEDVSRQTVTGRTSVVVHPAEFYLGVKSPADFLLGVTSGYAAEVIAATPDGTKKAGVAVQLDAVQRTWDTVAETVSDDVHYESRAVDKVVSSCSGTTSATGVASCSLSLAEPGYYILRAHSADARKNPIAASTSVYVSGGSTSSVAWRRGDGATLELVANRKMYEVGDTAKILVKSPFREAEAIVTVERAGIYRQERVTLTGAMPTLDVKLTDDLRPNAFVSVQLVRGRIADKATKGTDLAGPQYATGLVQLSINPEARRLKVDVTPAKKDVRPGDSIDVDLKVTDRSGRGSRADVAFYAVDEGVLMLTGYKTPDPLPAFTRARPLAVFGLELREAMARVLRMGPAGLEDKGDEGGGGGSMSSRQDFRSTAVFIPSVVTGQDGKAHVSFKLPDSLTTYRLMAVATSNDDRYGFGESQVVASRELMARPALPRFLRAGDHFEASVVVANKSLPTGPFEVSLSTRGVNVIGTKSRTVQVEKGQNVEVRFPVEAPLAGDAEIGFRVRGQGKEDDVKVSRVVDVPMSPEAVALYGETTSSSAERLTDLSAVRKDVGGLDVRLSSTALVGLDDGVAALLNYPYGCTEQLTSRMMPLVALVELAKDYNIALPKDPNGKIEEAIRKVIENQRGDGGFGYWPGSLSSDPFLSAYALFGLQMAKDRGRFVPPDALSQATRFVRQSLASPAVADASKAFMLDVLSSSGHPDPGFLTRIFERRGKLPLFARAWLTHAMVKVFPKEAEELAADLEGHIRITPTGATVADNVGDDYAVQLDSEARTTALVLRALVAQNPSHAMAARLAKGLLAARTKGAWRSTQENAWALIALDDYRKAQEKDVPSFDVNVFLGQSQVFDAQFHGRDVSGRSTNLPMAKLFEAGAGGQNLAFQMTGTGKLFYAARLRYARTSLPKSPLDRGFFVQKFVRTVEASELREALRTLPKSSADNARAGALVLVDLMVVTPDPRHQVVIDDPLPAGLEAVSSQLMTTAHALEVSEPGDEDDSAGSEPDDRAQGRAVNYAPYHREVHDDRVLTFVEHMPAGLYHYRYLARATTFGSFVVPPARAECMYEPETFGRTGSTTFEVR